MQPDSKRLRKIALAAITIAVLLVLATGVSCTSIAPAKPEAAAVQPALRAPQGLNQACDTCHDAQAGDIQMQLYVFVPGQPEMNNFDAAEKLLQGANSTAMGFSSRGCLPPAPEQPAAMALSLTVDAGVPPGGGVIVFQAGPPPPRVGPGAGADSSIPPSPLAAPMPEAAMKKPVHDCMPAAGKGYKLCEEPIGPDGVLQPDGVVYFKPVTASLNDYRFVPCKYAREQKIRAYADVTQKLSADQWIHFTGTHSGTGPTWAVTRQP
jgi:hypothetical protein